MSFSYRDAISKKTDEYCGKIKNTDGQVQIARIKTKIKRSYYRAYHGVYCILKPHREYERTFERI